MAVLVIGAAFVSSGCATATGSASGNRPEAHVARIVADFEVRIPDVPDLTREKFGQVHAALGSVIQFWGLDVEPEEMMGVRSTRVGSGSEEDAMALAESKGLWTFASYGSMELLKERVAHGIPVIVALQGNRDYRGKRWPAVVIGFDDRTQNVLCQTGVGKPVVYSYAEFDAKWRTLRRWMLVVCPAEKAEWPLSVMELCTRAKFRSARGQTDAAIADFKAAIRLQPGESAIHNALGNLFSRAGRLQDAENCYRAAVLANPEDSKARNNLAYFLAEHGRDLDEAMDLAVRATRVEPTNPLTLDTLGYIYLQKGQAEEAVDTLEQAHAYALQLPPGQRAEIAIRLVRAQIESGQIQRAREVVGDLMLLGPDVAVPAEFRALMSPVSASIQ